jgi:hypothetical protein
VDQVRFVEKELLQYIDRVPRKFVSAASHLP